MHVSTEAPLSADQTLTTLQNATGAGDAVGPPPLRGDFDRQPPKLYLGRLPLVPPAAEIVAMASRPNGTEVILRLMWGPLPAPFPRAVAALGVLAAALVLLISDSAWPQILVALALLGPPLAALLYQRAGERDLQQRVAAILGGAAFRPRPH